MNNPVLLTERDVREVLAMPDLIAAMDDALVRFSSGEVQQPVRTVLEVGGDRSFFGVMPAALSSPPAMGAKLVTVFHRNLPRGLPSHLATILLLDPESGALQAILDGRYITEARTAAVSAVSVQHLARPEASVLAIIGSGVQARSHLEAIRHVRALSEVRVWSPDVLHREAFAFEMSDATGLRVLAVSSAQAALIDADLIALVTSSRTPVIDDRDVRAGAHIVAVGACRPDQREMPAALVARARVFVDSREAAWREAGDLVLARAEGAIGDAHVAGELGELAAGRVAGRERPESVTIFKSLGLAVEDLAAARLALTKASAAGIGATIAL